MTEQYFNNVVNFIWSIAEIPRDSFKKSRFQHSMGGRTVFNVWGAQVAADEPRQHKYIPLFEALSRSRFRSRFILWLREISYLRDKGMDELMRHVEDLLDARPFVAHPANDGKQMPMRGHPVFIASMPPPPAAANHAYVKGSSLAT